MLVPLREIASARSGDKGIHANIGVISHSFDAFSFLLSDLSEKIVFDFFHEKFPQSLKSVRRYELPNLLSFNFILEGVLGKGGSMSLRLDAQGKVLGQVMMELPLLIPPPLLNFHKEINNV